jgi:hypothetical protein
LQCLLSPIFAIFNLCGFLRELCGWKLLPLRSPGKPAKAAEKIFVRCKQNLMTAKRTMRYWIVALAALAVIVMLFATLAGSTLVVNAPERSDVILILAGETNHRPARGLQLLDQGYGQRLLIDVPAEASTFGASEVQLATKYAQALPEAASIGICPIVGLSTRDESQDAEKCLEREQASRVLIVTSDFHTRRALSIFRHEIHGKTFSIAASYDEAQFGMPWWRRRQWAKTFFEEGLRFLWWNAVDRWR